MLVYHLESRGKWDMESVSQKKWLMNYFSEITQQQKHTIIFKGNPDKKLVREKTKHCLMFIIIVKRIRRRKNF